MPTPLSHAVVGAGLLMPFDSGRFFFLWRPIEVAAIHPARFLEDAARVLGSELLWVWCPGLLVLLLGHGSRWLRGCRGVSGLGILGKTLTVTGPELARTSAHQAGERPRLEVRRHP